MKSTSLCTVLDDMVIFERVFVLKQNSFGTVVDRTVFFGGGTEIKSDPFRSFETVRAC